MTGGGSASARRLLLFDDVDHPWHTIFIGHFAETVCPEGLLPGHFNVTARGELVEPAFAFGDVLGVEYQGETRVLCVTAGHAVAHHDFAACDTNVGVGNRGVRECHA